MSHAILKPRELDFMLYEFLDTEGGWEKKTYGTWHPCIAVARPFLGPTSEPIEASSDETALFELIHSAGGRMPEA